MNPINLDRPYVLEKEQILKKLKRKYENYRQIDVQLPSIESLEREVPLETLEVPWSVDLSGYRIANFNGVGLRILKRDDGKVTWSRRLQRENHEFIYGTFVQSIQEKLDRLIDAGVWPNEGILSYDLQTCARLLRETFLKVKKPRLVPEVMWPTRDECVEMIRAEIPNIPWMNESPGSEFLKLEVMDDGKFHFEAQNERGNIVAELTSANSYDVYWALFKHLTNKDSLDNDDNFCDAWFYIKDDESARS